MEEKEVWRKTVYRYAPEEERNTVSGVDYITEVSISSRYCGGWEVLIEEQHKGTLTGCIWTKWECCGFEWFNAYRDALRYAEDIVARNEHGDYSTVFYCLQNWRW